MLRPLITQGRTFGSLNLASRRLDLFPPQDVELLQRVAAQIAIAVENALAFKEIDALKNKLAVEKLYLEEEIRSEFNFEEIVGESAVLKRALARVELAAPAGTTVLLLGETGTGKELFARAIHNLSPRRDRTFVKINCAAIPSGLLESELFGHEKGAFTGAIAQKVGRFELADRGTLFLDEVGDLRSNSSPSFSAFCRSRIRTSRRHANDSRGCSCRCRHQLRSFETGRRARLSQRPLLPPQRFPIQIPRCASVRKIFPSSSAISCKGSAAASIKRSVHSRRRHGRASNYSWPGNIRELENLLERAVLLSPAGSCVFRFPS